VIRLLAELRFLPEELELPVVAELFGEAVGDV
jgi:hypothetical protein